jgi:RNA polymerase sigma factor (sigma-70 family)
MASPRSRPCRPAPPAIDAKLVMSARAGDREARATLLERHLGVVRHQAARYRGLGLPMEDLVQEGAIGLLRAIDTYDPGRGASFATFARWPVRCAIRRAIVERGRTVRVPRRLLTLRRRPGEGIAATASLDAPVDDTGTPLIALLPDPAAPDPVAETMRHEREGLLRDAIAHLPPRRRYVIEHHFGLSGAPQTLTDLATELHISRQRTQEIRTEGLTALAEELERSAGGAVADQDP